MITFLYSPSHLFLSWRHVRSCTSAFSDFVKSKPLLMLEQALEALRLMLLPGANKVLAIDVGTEQLHPHTYRFSRLGSGTNRYPNLYSFLACDFLAADLFYLRVYLYCPVTRFIADSKSSCSLSNQILPV